MTEGFKITYAGRVRDYLLHRKKMEEKRKEVGLGGPSHQEDHPHHVEPVPGVEPKEVKPPEFYWTQN